MSELSRDVSGPQVGREHSFHGQNDPEAHVLHMQVQMISFSALVKFSWETVALKIQIPNTSCPARRTLFCDNFVDSVHCPHRHLPGYSVQLCARAGPYKMYEYNLEIDLHFEDV